MNTEENLLVSIPKSREALGGIGQTLFYELVKSGHLQIVKIRRRSFVTASSLREYVDSLSRQNDGDAA